MDLSSKICSNICFNCDNPGEMPINYSKLHKICEQCSSFSYQSVVRCRHCTSIMLYINSFHEKNSQQNQNKIIIKEDSEPQAEADSEKNKIPANKEPEENSKPRFCRVFETRLEDYICSLCNTVIDGTYIIFDCNHVYCTNCNTYASCIKCKPVKTACQICGSSMASLLNCNHLVCKSCRKHENCCANCFDQTLSVCSFCNVINPEKKTCQQCKYTYCSRCIKDKYCFRKKCVKKNIVKNEKIVGTCAFCFRKKNKMMRLLCDHFVCKECFNYNMIETKFVCWQCVSVFEYLECNNCNKTIAWEKITESIMFKLCCKKTFCILCFHVLEKNELEHKCRLKIFN